MLSNKQITPPRKLYKFPFRLFFIVLNSIYLLASALPIAIANPPNQVSPQETYQGAVISYKKVEKTNPTADYMITGINREGGDTTSMSHKLSGQLIEDRLKSMILKKTSDANKKGKSKAVYILHDVARRRKEAALGINNKPILSPVFNTEEGNKGYNIALNIYPNGYRKGIDTHLSVFCALIKGIKDDHREWPCNIKIGFKILNQETGKSSFFCNHWMPEAKPELTGLQYQRPDDDSRFMGYDKFISHSDLKPPYLVNDTLAIEVTTTKVNTRKSKLSNPFSMKSEAPKHELFERNIAKFKPMKGGSKISDIVSLWTSFSQHRLSGASNLKKLSP